MYKALSKQEGFMKNTVKLTAIIVTVAVVLMTSMFIACVDPDEHEHQWNAHKRLTSATCGMEGVEELSCTWQSSYTKNDCTAKKIESIPIDPNNHDLLHGTIEDITVQPTCTTRGTGTMYCGCKKIKNTSENNIPANGHDVSYKRTANPTCSVFGKEEGVCKICNVPQTREIPKLEHNVSSWTTIDEGTCTKGATRAGDCKICKQTIYTTATSGHTFPSGSLWCSKCGASRY
jgi:hypothetical protein